MLDETKAQFDDNIVRVKNLVRVYTDHLAGYGQGRRPVHSSDVLRAATVLLHATLEEFLRGVSAWKLPQASEDVLDGIPLVGSQRHEKYTLGKLASHRGKSVDGLISESVGAYLQRTNYNSTHEICSLLDSVGVQLDPLRPHLPTLGEFLERRHLIVHRADRDDRPGRGYHRARSIGRKALNRWVETVVMFAAAICSQLDA